MLAVEASVNGFGIVAGIDYSAIDSVGDKRGGGVFDDAVDANNDLFEEDALFGNGRALHYEIARAQCDNNATT